jgi:hypothetical protein
MIQGIAAFFKIVLFFLKMNANSNKAKKEEGRQKGREIVDAMSETNKNLRAARLAAALDGVQSSKKK